MTKPAPKSGQNKHPGRNSPKHRPVSGWTKSPRRIAQGRSTLVCGVRVAAKRCSPWSFWYAAHAVQRAGVFMAFEEAAKDLTQNVASLGFDLKDLVDRKMMVLDLCTSIAAKSKRPANMIWKGCSSAWSCH